jgi:fructokinase
VSAPARPDHRGAAIGVDVGGTKLEAVALDPAGGTLWRERVDAPRGDYEVSVRAIAALARRGKAAAGAPHATVGLGTPGTVTPAGVMKNCNSTWLNGRPLPRDLQAALGEPVRIANDANCLALSEATDGAGGDARVVFAAILGTGTGAGIAVERKVLTGPNGLAGEWGHNPLPWAAADEAPSACYCGRAGCIETWLSGPALAADHQRRHGERLTAREIAEGAARGDAACTSTLERYESRLARALASVINLLDPDVIVLGGGLSLIERLYVSVPRLWGAHVFSGGVREPVRTRLVPSAHGDASGVRGAAWLWRESAGR